LSINKLKKTWKNYLTEMKNGNENGDKNRKTKKKMWMCGVDVWGGCVGCMCGVDVWGVCVGWINNLIGL
jgi:hypothetical protein